MLTHGRYYYYYYLVDGEKRFCPEHPTQCLDDDSIMNFIIIPGNLLELTNIQISAQDKVAVTSNNTTNCNQFNQSFSASSFNSWSDKWMMDTTTTTTMTTTKTVPPPPASKPKAAAPASCLVSSKSKCRDVRRRVHF